MNLTHYLWTIPFMSFLAGYLFVRSLSHVEEIKTPSLVGKSLYQAVNILSEHNLNPRIIAEKEDPDLPEGTIISQTPPTNQTIKPIQSVFLVIAQKPATQHAPSLINKSIDVITQELIGSGIRTKVYYMPSNHGKDRCIAQIPQIHEPLEKNIVTLYLSAGSNKPIIWPDFVNKPLHEVQEFLHEHNIDSQIIPHASRKVSYDATHEYDPQSSIVTDQRPLSGSLIVLDAKHPPCVQLHVR